MTVFTEYGFEIQVFELNENTLFDDLINNVSAKYFQRYFMSSNNSLRYKKSQKSLINLFFNGVRRCLDLVKQKVRNVIVIILIIVIVIFFGAMGSSVN